MIFILIQKFNQFVVSIGWLCILYLSLENLYNLFGSSFPFSSVFSVFWEHLNSNT